MSLIGLGLNDYIPNKTKIANKSSKNFPANGHFAPTFNHRIVVIKYRIYFTCSYARYGFLSIFGVVCKICMIIIFMS